MSSQKTNLLKVPLGKQTQVSLGVSSSSEGDWAKGGRRGPGTELSAHLPLSSAQTYGGISHRSEGALQKMFVPKNRESSDSLSLAETSQAAAMSVTSKDLASHALTKSSAESRDSVTLDGPMLVLSHKEAYLNSLGHCSTLMLRQPVL